MCREFCKHIRLFISKYFFAIALSIITGVLSLFVFQGDYLISVAVSLMSVVFYFLIKFTVIRNRFSYDDIIFQNSSVYVKENSELINWNDKNVLIGAVRSLHQLKYNIENNCYYVPARFVNSDNLPVKCIAIYEDDADGTFKIKRKAYVKETKILKRKHIPVPMSKKNGDELYYYFLTDKWELINNPLIVKDTYRGKPLYTNEFLLDNCKYSYQLFVINSDNEYNLMKAIEFVLENNNTVFKINNTFSLRIQGGRLIIINNYDKSTCEFYVSDYINRPRLTFNKVKKIINEYVPV